MSEIDDSSDATRLIMPRISQKFDSAFKEFKHRAKEKENREALMSNVKLIEAEEKLAVLERTIATKDQEIERSRKVEQNTITKLAEVRNENELLKQEMEEYKKLYDERNESKINEKLLLDSYRNALSKYRTWYEFSTKQLETTKDLLENCGRWTDDARFKIYFSYQSIAPIMISDDEVANLAFGSILDYKGIENIEGITAITSSSKTHNGSTQTDDSMFSKESSLYYSMDAASNVSASDESTVIKESTYPTGLTTEETIFVDLKNRVQKLENENIKLKEQFYVANHKAKRVPLVEEEKRDLESRLNVITKQNHDLINELETLKDSIRNEVFTDMAGPAKRASAQEIIRNIIREKQKNDELHNRIRILEEEELNRLEMIRQAESEVESLQKDLSETREEAQSDVENLKKELAETREKARLELESLKGQLSTQKQPTSSEAPSDSSKALTAAETRRISEFFKKKYENEIEELRKKLRKYENVSVSDTTQIFRFRRFNPLDEAHDEYLLKEAAADAASSNVKRRKIDSSSEQGADETMLDPDISANESVSYQNLRSQLRAAENKAEETLKANSAILERAKQYRELVRDLVGYQIKMRTETDIEVESVYDRGHYFNFRTDPISHAMEMLENEYTGRWTEQMQRYLGEHHSIPAFLAAVNLYLLPRADESSIQATFSVVHED